MKTTDTPVSGQKPSLTKDGKSIICKTDNFVPLVVPGLSTIPESRASSASLSQDSLRKEAEQAPRELVQPASSSSSSSVSERSDELASRRLVPFPKIQNQNKMRSDRKNSDDPLADLPEWLEEFKENLEDTALHASAHTLRTQIQNVLRKWQQNQGNTVSPLTSQKTEIATCA